MHQLALPKYDFQSNFWIGYKETNCDENQRDS
jgi:hypothetical protein